MASTAFALTGVDETLRALQELPAEIVSKNGGPVRAALRKGALVILNAEKALLQQSLDPESSGLLLDNLVVTRGKAPKVGKGERYLVRVKSKTYVRNGKPVTTLKTAQIKEYGSEKQAAEPFIIPAFNSSAGKAVDTTIESLNASIDRITKKLGLT